MSYSTWFTKHQNKHRKIIDKLISTHLTKEEIVAYFDFENMVRNEPDFCYLYKENKKCHEVGQLNCYLCACPLFRFSDDGIGEKEGKTIFSKCSVESKFGEQKAFGESIHLDCSNCTVPHSPKYVLKNFDLEWSQIMKASNLEDRR